MMGPTHLVTGVLAWEIVELTVHLTPMQAATGAILVPCAALLPDIDHRKATVSRSLGPVTVAASRVMAALGGGHRKGTHSAFGVLALGAVLWLCVQHRHNLAAELVLCAVLIPTLAAGIRLARIPGWIDDLAPIPIVITTVFLSGINLQAIPIAMMTGCAAHIAGDCLTNSGCPILWPLTTDRFALRLFRTGKRTEKWIVFPVMLITMVVLAMYLVWNSLMTSQ